VPRILVADDNSNIHRSVALALKEAGVEVVAVGNGEAAVRKIAETKPDLVLADIFMPVRSGYEVCEFVKQDPRFANVPVVLLIGAFDPFDEREAQRVKADAILKKPFVPPDSLLRTVTDLLAQTASKSSPAPAAAAPAKPERPPVSIPPAGPTQQAAPVEYVDQAPEEIAPAKARLEWNPGEQPVAFGTLLETPGSETETPESTDAVLTAHRDPTLGEPAFWTSKAQQQAEEGEEAEESEAESSAALIDEEQWHSATGLEELESEEQSASEIALPEPLAEEPETLPELPELVLSEAETIEPAAAQSEPALDFELPELPSLDLAPTAPTESLPTPPTPARIPVPSLERTKRAETTPEADEPLPDLKDFEWAATTHAPDATDSKPESELAEDDEAPAEEAIKPPAPMATLAPFLAGLTSAASARKNAEPPEAQEHSELDEVSDLPSHFEDEDEDEDVESELASTEPFDEPAVAQLDPAIIEAIAQRVIGRMQPKLIELVTRELLRPAVEALVQRELEKK
jgi:CheY-like chemotaxis protein